MTVLQEKALTCLTIAEMTIGSPERVQALKTAAERYSWRALTKKIEELVERGYIEPLIGGTACGGLTAKGAAALQAHRATHAD